MNAATTNAPLPPMDPAWIRDADELQEWLLEQRELEDSFAAAR